MITFIFKAKDGKPDFGSSYNEARFRQVLKESEGKEFRVDKLVRKRSFSQNNLYHFYLDIIERDTGETHNEMHEYFKRIFLPPKIIRVMGKEIKIPKSTTELNKVEFGDYLDKICAMTGVPIPDTELYKKYIDSAPTK